MSEALLKCWRAALPYTGGQAKLVLRRMIAELETEIECRAKAGDSETGGKLVSGVDPAGRLPARRIAGATEVAGRDSRERPAPKPVAPGPVPETIPDSALAYLRASVVPMLQEAGMALRLNPARTKLRVDQGEPMDLDDFLDWVNDRFELEGEDTLRLPMTPRAA
jgi:hypothetical protein